jgi:hypothetical protein
MPANDLAFPGLSNLRDVFEDNSGAKTAKTFKQMQKLVDC